MPPAGICTSCPTQEYKTLKKKNRKRRSTPEEVCTEKGEGVWADPTDCTKYFICRSMSTAWAEKKQETCYVGSYFDQKGGQCKWVGQGNYDCNVILGKEDDSKSESKTESAKSGDSDSDGGESIKTGIYGIKNRQKIFYDIQASNSKQQPDSMIPPNLYTCPAELNVDYESNADYIKCYSCESDAKNLQKCKGTPNSDSTLVIWCYAKTQKCYSKEVHNTKNEEVISFSRGCASLSDLESGDSSATTTTSSPPSSDSGNATKVITNCVQKSNSTKSCYTVCDTHLCNTVTEIKSAAVSKNNLNGTIYSIVISFFILVIVSPFNY
jgi:hypothetical protein